MRRRQNNVDDYLSIKRIILISLAITIAFYLLYTLTYFFGRPTMTEPDWEKEKPQTELQVDANTPSEINANPTMTDAKKPPMGEGEKRGKKPMMMVILLLNIPLTFILVFAVLLYNRKIMSRQFRLLRDEIVVNILGSLFIGLLLSALITILQTILWPNPPGPQRSLFHHISRGWLSDLPLVSIAIMACYLLRSINKERMTAVENESLRAENMLSRYETLKSQMDPHFLFNSLNTLKSLIEVEPNKADEFVQRLSSVLRYTLQNKEVVTLAEEMDCVRSYCIMMKMRFGDNIKFEPHIDHDKYDSFHVLPLSIQGLMENAIKHNVISTKHPLTVTIVTDDDNHLIVSNNIQEKLSKEESSGIGLANLSERYRIKWDEKVGIFDDGKIFKVTLPLKENE